MPYNIGNESEDAMVTEAQKRATEAYRRKCTKSVTVRFYPSESDIFEHMERQGGRSSYIKRLIRDDMEGGGSR